MHATEEGVPCGTHGQSSPLGGGVRVQVRAQAEVGYGATGVPRTAALRLTSKDPSF